MNLLLKIKHASFFNFFLFTAAVLILSPVSLAYADLSSHFQFGSYGRVGIATTESGEKVRPVNVVTHGARLEEENYAELNFRYFLKKQKDKQFNVQIEFTLALFNDFFHFTGDPSSQMAIRNLYAYANNVVPGFLGIWVGSRMYRGDDLYLFDYWPLDNLNTLGAGADFTICKHCTLSLHSGLNQPKNSFFYQEINTVSNDFGPEKMVFMDRQKSISSVKFEQMFFNVGNNNIGIKYKLYAELHYLPKGVMKRADTVTYQNELLPSDLGFLIGAQLGIWNFAPNSFVNLFLKYATGLAAYGEWATPFGLDKNKKTTSAKEFVTALMLNYETNRIGIMAGTYFRYFKDADPNEVDLDDGWEYMFAVRPALFIAKHFHQLIEISYQVKDKFGLNPTTGKHEIPAVFKAALMPAVSWDKGSFSRPELRLVLSASWLNQAARNLFLLNDPRRNRSWEYFIGVQAEWWFHSSYSSYK